MSRFYLMHLMQSVCGTINVAALEADKCLHDAGTLWALHILRDLPGNERNIYPAALAFSVKKLVMVVFERNFEALHSHVLLPFVKLLQHLQNRGPMATGHHTRPFTEHNPSTLVLVGKQLVDFVRHRVRFGLPVGLGKEKAVYAVPEMA